MGQATQPEHAQLYTTDKIRPYLLPQRGGDSAHLVLYRAESGNVCASVMEGTIDGEVINVGDETDDPCGHPALNLYQGLASDTALELKRLVFASHNLSRTGKVGQDAILRYLDRKLLIPGSESTPLTRVEDERWWGGYKWTPRGTHDER